MSRTQTVLDVNHPTPKHQLDAAMYDAMKRAPVPGGAKADAG